MESLDELIEEFMDLKRIHTFEGDSGLQNLETLFTALGYKRHGFRYGTIIESFLSDNPGACDALVEWIREQNIREWRESIENELPEKENDEESEED